MAVDFLFLFSPNNSGTTVMCQYLASQCDAYLPPWGHNEGQMAPGARRLMRIDPWNPAQDYEWHKIRPIWEDLAAEAGKTLFVEGSPPNMVRFASIMRRFEGHAKAAFAISNPYLQIASSLKNYHSGEIDDAAIVEYTRRWTARANIQFDNLAVDPSIPLVRYEDFCREPAVLNRAFGLPVLEADAVFGKRTSGASRILDLTAKNVAFLTAFEVERISSILSDDGAPVDQFGYELLDLVSYDRLLGHNIGLAHAGLLDRFRYEQRGGRRRPKHRRQRPSTAPETVVPAEQA